MSDQQTLKAPRTPAASGGEPARESMRADFVLSEVPTGLRRNITMTVAMILTTAISLGLLGGGLIDRPDDRPDEADLTTTRSRSPSS